MPFPEQFLQELSDRNDIVDVVSSYVRLTKKSGTNLFGLCPFHSEKTPSFSVSSDKQIYHCFGCGKGGSVIQKIVADTGAKIDIEDDGTIRIASANSESAEAAKHAIDQIVFVPEVGSLYYGRVVRLMQFGAFVELAPGKDGLVHISKLADHRIEKVEDACKIGDMMWVKVTDIDEKGRVNLSHKDAVREIKAKEAAGERIK